MEIAIIALASVLLGWTAGSLAAEWRQKRRDVAPVPDFDINNRMNARARTETACGVRWTVYGGRP